MYVPAVLLILLNASHSKMVLLNIHIYINIKDTAFAKTINTKLFKTFAIFGYIKCTGCFENIFLDFNNIPG